MHKRCFLPQACTLGTSASASSSQHILLPMRSWAACARAPHCDLLFSPSRKTVLRCWTPTAGAQAPAGSLNEEQDAAGMATHSVQLTCCCPTLQVPLWR